MFFIIIRCNIGAQWTILSIQCSRRIVEQSICIVSAVWNVNTVSLSWMRSACVLTHIDELYTYTHTTSRALSAYTHAQYKIVLLSSYQTRQNWNEKHFSFTSFFSPLDSPEIRRHFIINNWIIHSRRTIASSVIYLHVLCDSSNGRRAHNHFIWCSSGNKSRETGQFLFVIFFFQFENKIEKHCSEKTIDSSVYDKWSARFAVKYIFHRYSRLEVRI